MIKKLFKLKTDSTYIQLFRYVFVGALAFAVDIGILISLTELFFINYLVSAVVGFIAGLIVNYILSTKWVFNNRTLKSKKSEFTLFALIGIIGLCLNELILWLSTDLLKLFYVYSKLISTFIVFGWNFSARKFLLFKGKTR